MSTSPYSCTRTLEILPAVISSKAVERGNDFAHKVSLPYFEGFFNMPQNLFDIAPTTLLHLQRGLLQIIDLKNPSPLAGFEPAYL
jgi:hypothetical protein